MHCITIFLIIGACYSLNCKAAATASQAADLSVEKSFGLKSLGKTVSEDASVDEKASMIARVYINDHLCEYDPLIPFKTFLEKFNEHLTALKADEPIKKLDFSSRNRLTDEFFRRLYPILQNLTALEELNLCENYLTRNSLDLCLRLASELSDLKNICVGGNAISYGQLEAFKEDETDKEVNKEVLDKISVVLKKS